MCRLHHFQHSPVQMGSRHHIHELKKNTGKNRKCQPYPQFRFKKCDSGLQIRRNSCCIGTCWRSPGVRRSGKARHKHTCRTPPAAWPSPCVSARRLPIQSGGHALLPSQVRCNQVSLLRTASAKLVHCRRLQNICSGKVRDRGNMQQLIWKNSCSECSHACSD